MENLSNARKETQKANDLDERKNDLKAYMRYCDRACKLLDSAEEKTPGAARVVRRGLPIIDERIKEIQERAKELCKKTRDTQFEELGNEVNRQSHELLSMRDPVGVEKGINILR